jgi:hypothetical protein
MSSKTRKMAAKANSNNEKSLQEATELMEKGDMLAESFMGIFAMFATSLKGMGIATYALAKSWGALQAIAEEEGVDVKNLFENFSCSFKSEFDEKLLNKDYPLLN